MVGIVDYGVYIPVCRIKLEDIARVWRKNPGEILSALKVSEKSVAATDEDAVTLAYEAAKNCLSQGLVTPKQIEILLIGSESHPYAVNPTSTIVGELLGVGNKYMAADLEFACKAGTAGIQFVYGLISSGNVEYGMAIGADKAQSRPHDILEYTSAAASGAFLLGKKNVLANLLDFVSYSSDTPDFWRRDGMRFPTHAGRFSGKPAYFTHVLGAANLLINKSNIQVSKIDYCVFHMPNGKFPREAAKHLGFTDSQLLPSMIVERIGNPYSASSLLGLAAVLDMAKPGQTILMVSYGSGAGSDAFLWQVTSNIVQNSKFKLQNNITVEQQIRQKSYIDYTRYLQQTHKI